MRISVSFDNMTVDGFTAEIQKLFHYGSSFTHEHRINPRKPDTGILRNVQD